MRFTLTFCAVLAAAGAAEAGDVIDLSPACERALALSAAPAYLREAASVYVLGDDGFVLDREGSGAYACIVTRENVASLIPQCFDRVGQKSHLPVHLEEGRMIRAGAGAADLAAMRKEGFETGRFTPADGHGVVYMASAYNYIAFGEGRKLLVAPHVMYHAPHLTNEDVGAVMPDAHANFGMPFIQGEGPMGFMIGFTERPADTAEVEAACAGELPDRSEWPAYPPRD